MQKKLPCKKNSRSGQAMVEYALILSAFCGWAAVIYASMMRGLNIYLKSIYFMLTLDLP